MGVKLICCCFVFVIYSVFEVRSQQVQFCANRLKGTESGKEEHYLEFYKCESLSFCSLQGRTEEQNMEDDKPWRCWSQRMSFSPIYDANKFLTVRIYESDNGGAGDDLIGHSTVQISELIRMRTITNEVTEGDGAIKFDAIGL